MAFRYPLQSVLRLRQSLEQQEEQRLFAIAATVARLRTQIEQLEQSRLDERRTASQEMLDGTSGAIVQFAAVCDSAFSEAQKRLREQLAEAERSRLEQLNTYRVARQKREILESLRERQEADHDRDEAHREQEQADDHFLVKFGMGSSE
jgi:flagellar export protein FliJ